MVDPNQSSVKNMAVLTSESGLQGKVMHVFMKVRGERLSLRLQCIKFKYAYTNNKQKRTYPHRRSIHITVFNRTYWGCLHPVNGVDAHGGTTAVSAMINQSLPVEGTVRTGYWTTIGVSDFYRTILTLTQTLDSPIRMLTLTLTES